MRSKAYLVILFVVAVAVVVLRAWGGEPAAGIEGSPELFGLWTTTSPDHTDRYLEIDAREIAFGQGEEDEARYRLLGVVLTPRLYGRMQYSLRYRLDAATGEEGKLDVLVAGRELRIVSQPRIRWTVKR